MSSSKAIDAMEKGNIKEAMRLLGPDALEYINNNKLFPLKGFDPAMLGPTRPKYNTQWASELWKKVIPHTFDRKKKEPIVPEWFKNHQEYYKTCTKIQLLKHLRADVQKIADHITQDENNQPETSYKVIYGDVAEWMLKAKKKMTWQMASQANALEMVGPTKLPSHGMKGYMSDPTQGPDVALAVSFNTFSHQIQYPYFNAMERFKVKTYQSNPNIKEPYVLNGYLMLPCKEESKELENRIKTNSGNMNVMYMKNADIIGRKSDFETFKMRKIDESQHFQQGHIVPAWATPITQTYTKYSKHEQCKTIKQNDSSDPRMVIGEKLIEMNYESTFLIAIKLHDDPTNPVPIVLTWLGEGAFGWDDGHAADIVKKLLENKLLSNFSFHIFFNIHGKHHTEQIQSIKQKFKEYNKIDRAVVNEYFHNDIKTLEFQNIEL